MIQGVGKGGNPYTMNVTPGINFVLLLIILILINK
jgi:hypothetical protein